MKSDLVDFDVVLMAETPSAWKVRLVNRPHPGVWLAEDDCELYEPNANNVRQVTMPKRLAEKAGLRR